MPASPRDVASRPYALAGRRQHTLVRHRDRLQPHHGLPRGLVPLAATALIAATGVSIVPAFVLALISLLIVPLALGLPERPSGAGAREPVPKRMVPTNR
jgi:hypothetical protein